MKAFEEWLFEIRGDSMLRNELREGWKAALEQVLKWNEEDRLLMTLEDIIREELNE